MPFQSEKQRRYLHANHPEIAKRWERDYASGGPIAALNAQLNQLPEYYLPKKKGGIANHFRKKLKNGSYAVQGGVKNYLGNQKMVHAPKYWKSAPDHPNTELTYITKPEKELLVKADLHNSLHGNENKGPQGIVSLNGWGSKDSSQNKAGADISPSMDRNPNDPGWGGGGPGGGGKGHHPKGPTAAEIAAAKAKAEAEKRAAELKARKEWRTKKEKEKKKKVKHTKKIKDWVTKHPIETTASSLVPLGTLKAKEYFDDVNKINKWSKMGYGKGNPVPQKLVDTLKGSWVSNKTFEKLGHGAGSTKDWFFSRTSPKHFGPVEAVVKGLKSPVVKGISRTLPGLGTAYTVGDLLAQRSDAMGEEADRISTLEGDDQTEAIEEYATKMYKPYVTGGIANHFKKRTKLALSIDSMSDVEFKTMYPNWDPEQFTREEYLQQISETETNGILDVSTDDTDEVAQMSTTEDEVIPSLVPSLDQEVALVAKGGRILPKGPAGITSLNGWGDEDRGYEDSGWSPGVSHSGSSTDTGSSSGDHHPNGEDQEDDVARMMSDMGLKDDHTPNWSGPDRGWVPSEDEETEIGGVDYIGPKDRIRIRQDIVTRKEKFDSTWEKTKRTGSAIWGFMNITNPVGAAKFIYDQNKKKNERIAEIKYDLALLEKIGYEPHPWEEKDPGGKHGIKGDLEFELFKLENPNWNKGPTGDDSGDGLTIETIASAKEDVEESPNIMSLWDRIKAGQAKRAMLVEKDIIQEQPIQLLNRGGLATLFRVKT